MLPLDMGAFGASSRNPCLAFALLWPRYWPNWALLRYELLPAGQSGRVI